MAVSGDPIAEAAAAARAGRLIVFPTDTVYGIGTRPDDPAATDRVFGAKRRPGTSRCRSSCPPWPPPAPWR